MKGTQQVVLETQDLSALATTSTVPTMKLAVAIWTAEIQTVRSTVTAVSVPCKHYSRNGFSSGSIPEAARSKATRPSTNEGMESEAIQDDWVQCSVRSDSTWYCCYGKRYT